MNLRNLNVSHLALVVGSSLMFGCGGQIVNIVSEPPGAEVFSNRDSIGRTPLLTSKDEIMPLWSSDGTFTRAVITLRKPGFNDYKVFVNELSMPDLINAALVPLQAGEPKSKEPSAP